MRTDLKEIECDPLCGFRVRSRDEKEIIDMAMKHIRVLHPEKVVTIDQIKEDIKMVKSELEG